MSELSSDNVATNKEIDPLIGSKVGNYKLIRRLGAGGMGAVYEAVHALMGKRAAVKMLLPELSSNQEIVGRFFNEAKAATRIQHPSIVDVYDFGYHDTGHAYIVMEYLAGTSLTELLKQGLPFPRALDIAWQLASALGAAHKNGIVHRDIKPDNIYIVPDPATPTGDRVKVLDFGIAKLTGDDSVTSKTRTGTVMGTPVYMSPEQCKGSGEVDHRSDIYALGCIMFEMVCGQPPFVKNGFGELITAHIIEEPPRPSELNPSVPALYEAIVLRALEKEPDTRYQTTGEVEADLAAINLETAGNVTIAPVAQHAGGTGRSKLRPGAAGRGRTRTGTEAGLHPNLKLPATEVAKFDAETRGNKRKLIALAAGGIALVAVIAILALPHTKKGATVEAPSTTPITVPAPAPAPEVAPKVVSLTITSNPSGAQVLRADDGSFLGKTPLTRPFPLGTGEMKFVVRAPGYEEQRVALPLLQDGALEVELSPVAAQSTPPAGGAVGKAKSNSVADKPAAGKGTKKKRAWGELVDF